MNPSASPSRVQYREGQVLVTADLRDEQEYLVGMRTQHFARSHFWGVATGLGLSLEADTLTISKGLAVDGFGRLLILSADVAILLRKTDSNVISIWLLYTEEISAPIPDRVREGADVQLRNHAAITTRQTAPRGADNSWPVYLGSLRRTNASDPFAIDTAKRPLIGLVGAAVQAASGSARVRCGEDFAVSISGTEKGEFLDQLVIGRNGNLHIRANAAFSNGLHVRPGTDTSRTGKAGVGFGSPCQPAVASRPWQIYRTQMLETNKEAKQQIVFETEGAQEKEDPSALRAVIGHNDGKRFVPNLLVSSDGNVTVNGLLKVGGRLIESPISPDVLDPRFVAALALAKAAAANVQANSLTVRIEAGRSKDHLNVEYALHVENKASEPMQIMQARVIARLNGQIVKQIVLPLSNTVLAPHAKHRVDQQMTFASPGEAEIGIGLLGMAANKLLTAQDTIAIQVT